jgi:hypothetical protein
MCINTHTHTCTYLHMTVCIWRGRLAAVAKAGPLQAYVEKKLDAMAALLAQVCLSASSSLLPLLYLFYLLYCVSHTPRARVRSHTHTPRKHGRHTGRAIQRCLQRRRSVGQKAIQWTCEILFYFCQTCIIFWRSVGQKKKQWPCGYFFGGRVPIARVSASVRQCVPQHMCPTLTMAWAGSNVSEHL